MRYVALIMALGGFAAPVWSAVPVEESTGTPVRGAPARGESVRAPSTPAARTPSSDSSGVVRTYPAPGTYAAASTAAANEARGSEDVPSGTGALFYQLQILQNEVRELRGMLEEQSHRIEQLEERQKEQYLDLDGRVSALVQGGAAPSASGPVGPTTATTAFPRTERTTTPSSSPGPAGGGADERTEYEAAYQLTVDKRYADAIAAFQRLVERYPNGQYAANAYYWLGELYLAQPDGNLEQARAAFERVVNAYPNHGKVPDALFKLGVVHHRLGEATRAIEYLNRVQSEHPSSFAARLAQTYAAEIR